MKKRVQLVLSNDDDDDGPVGLSLFLASRN